MIEDLLKTIRERKNSSPDKSYTSYLLTGGLGKCIEKLEEEFNLPPLKEALADAENEAVTEEPDDDEVIEKVIKAYQKDHNLTADGRVGPKTLRSIKMMGK